jgi:hypothetical protein
MGTPILHLKGDVIGHNFQTCDALYERGGWNRGGTIMHSDPLGIDDLMIMQMSPSTS